MIDTTHCSHTKSDVFIIGLSDCGEKVTAAGGRISTQPGTVLDIWAKSQDNAKNLKLIDRVTKSGHKSITEHTFYNLAFQNVSMMVEQFLIDMRLTSFTIKSRRYVDFSDAGFFIPYSIANDEHAYPLFKRYSHHMQRQFALYQTLLNAGIPAEDARFVLPYCLYSNILCSLDGNELLHMLSAMLYGRGAKYPEIKTLGESLLQQARKLTPGILTDFELHAASYDDTVDLSGIQYHMTTDSKKPVELMDYTAGAAQKILVNEIITQLGIPTADAIAIIDANPDMRQELLSRIVHSHRARALECANYTVRYNGVSLGSLTHFTRHRMQSLRVPDFIDIKHDAHIVPQSIADNSDLLALYEESFAENQKEYQYMRANGMDDTDLVYYLLCGHTVDIVSTMNARELLHFMKLRTCNRAQWEIRDFATKLLSNLRLVEPELFRFYGPNCFIDHCPEGRLTCGKAAEVKHVFENLS